MVSYLLSDRPDRGAVWFYRNCRRCGQYRKDPVLPVPRSVCDRPAWRDVSGEKEIIPPASVLNPSRASPCSWAEGPGGWCRGNACASHNTSGVIPRSIECKLKVSRQSVPHGQVQYKKSIPAGCPAKDHFCRSGKTSLLHNIFTRLTPPVSWITLPFCSRFKAPGSGNSRHDD